MNKILKFLNQKNFLKHRKNVISLCSFLLFIFLIIPSISFSADAGKHLGFQGQLLNTSNAPQTGTYTMTFSFYDALTTGNLQGSTITKSVTVSNGYFAVDFSESDLSGIVFNKDMWMEMSVDGTAMSPRSPVNSVPYSNVAFGIISGSGAPSISNPADGALYFDTTGNIFYVYDGSSWSKVMSGSVTSADILNGTIATADLANNSVDGTKISLTSETTGDTMYYDGTNWVHSGALQNDGTNVTVTGTLTTGSNITGSGALTVNSAAASALVLDSGTSGSVNIGTSASGKNITIGNATGTTFLTINSGADSVGGGVLINVPDNVANIFRVRQGSNNYISLTTTNSSENLTFGNITTNPSFNFAGTGNGLFGGAITVTGYSTFSNGLSANSNRIQDVATPISVNDATSKNYVDTLFSSAITYTSPVYDLASSDPGVTPNTRRFIDTIDWSGCGVGSIVSSDGGGSYACDQISVNGLTTSVTNLGETYTYNGSAWVSTGSTVNHNSLNGIQGGQIGEYYHLDSAAYSALTDGNAQLVDLQTTGSPTFNQVTASTKIFNGDGDVSAPSYTFVNDTDTGMYRPTNNEISIATGGTRAFTVNGLGFVGIGDVDPSYSLDIGGIVRLSSNLLFNETTNNISTIGFDLGDGNGTLTLTGGNSGATSEGATIRLMGLNNDYEGGDMGGLNLYAGDNGWISNYTGGVDRLEISPTGQVGINSHDYRNVNGGLPTDDKLTVFGNIGNIFDSSRPTEDVVQIGSTVSDRPLYYGAIKGNYVFSVGDDGWIRSYDTRNNPVQLGSVSNTIDLTFPPTLKVVGNYAYVTSTGGFSVFNISDPNNMLLLSTVNTSKPYVTDIEIKGKYLYAVNTDGNTTLIDIIDITSSYLPVNLSSYDLTSSFGGALYGDMVIEGNFIYMLDKSNNVYYILETLSDMMSPTFVSSMVVSGDVTKIAHNGRYSYVISSGTNKRLEIIDTYDKVRPSIISSIDFDNNPTDIFISGRYAYITSDNGSLYIVDINDPANPIFVKNISTISGRNVIVQGKKIIILGSEGVAIYSTSGVETSNALVHSLEAGALAVQNDFSVNGDIISNGALNLTGSILSGGGLGLNGTLSFNGSSGTSGQYLKSNGPYSAPEWQTITASVSLDQIGPALNSAILHNDTYEQKWYWSLTGVTDAFVLDEDTFSSGTGYIFKVNTKGGSTAKPFTVLAHESAIIDTNANGDLTLGSTTNNTRIDLKSGTSPINIGADASTKTISIGGTSANTIAIGNTQTGGSVSIGSAMTTGTIRIGGIGNHSGNIIIGDGGGNQTIIIGNGAGNKSIDIGTNGGTGITNLYAGSGGMVLSASGGAGNITIGDTANAGAISIQSGSGAISIGTSNVSKTITIGNSASTSSLVLNSGTGALDLGTNAIAHTVTIGNVTGATAVNVNTGTAGTTYTTTNGIFTLATGTGTVSISNDATANTLNIGTGAGAKTITLGSVATGASTAINSGSGGLALSSSGGTMTLGSGSSSITIGGGTQSGSVLIGTSSASQTISIGLGGSNIKTVNLGTATSSSVTNIRSGSGGIALTSNSGATTISGASFTLTTGTGATSISDDATVNTITIGTGAAAKTITIGSTSGSLALKASSAVTIQGSGTTCSIGNGTGTTSCTSDARLKENVTNLDDETLTKVLALRPVVFNWNNIAGYDQSIAHIGLIAQEVQTQFGDAVHTVYHSDALNDDVLGVDYGYLVVPTIKAVQEQQALMGEIITTEGMTTLVVDIQNEIARDPVVIINEKINNNTKFLTDFVVARVTTIRGYFDEVFAKKATLEEVCLKDGNGVSCYNRSQLDAVINNANTPTQNITNTTTSTPDTTIDVNTTPVDNIETTQEGEVVNNPTPDATTPTTPDPIPTDAVAPTSESI